MIPGKGLANDKISAIFQNSGFDTSDHADQYTVNQWTGACPDLIAGIFSGFKAEFKILCSRNSDRR
jgi:hypothetical protein